MRLTAPGAHVVPMSHMVVPMMRVPTLAALLAAVLLLAGCAARSVPIAELKDRPTNYENKSVRIVGMVTTSFGIPLVPFQVYNVDDGTGEISVLSRSGSAPTRGTRVEVRGQLSQLAVIGGRSLGLHLREEDRKVRN